jgi:hypothetical protein
LDGFASSAQFDHCGFAPASLPLGPPPVFGGFRGPSFYYSRGHVIDLVNGMGSCQCHHQDVGPYGSVTPMSSGLPSDHSVKNIATAKLAGIDPNSLSTTKDGAPVKEKTKKQADPGKGKTKKHFDPDDEDSISSGSTSDSSEGSYVEVEDTDSDGSESDDSKSSGEE